MQIGHGTVYTLGRAEGVFGAVKNLGGQKFLKTLGNPSHFPNAKTLLWG
jgi:hypothetical protein